MLIQQVNLDFDSEEDMVKKFRVGLALQPVSECFLLFEVTLGAKL